jgi:RNA polymerase sigma-70 factor (ECF subfamily)
MSAAISSGCDVVTTWLDSISITVAPMRPGEEPFRIRRDRLVVGRDGVPRRVPWASSPSIDSPSSSPNAATNTSATASAPRPRPVDADGHDVAVPTGEPDEAGDGDRFADLLPGLRTRDPAAVEWVFVRLQPRLLRFLRSQERSVADDVAADVWLAVARGVGEFEGSWPDFRAWCFAIARRRVADHRRTAARRRTQPVDTAWLDGLAIEDLTERQALAALSGEQAATLIASVLQGDQAEVVLLRILGELDVNQVAAVMGRSPNWVRVTQHRAVRKLARRLGPKIAVIR